MNDNGLRLHSYCYAITPASFIVLINRDAKGIGGKYTAGKISTFMFMKMDRISIYVLG
jgi:hypothetical protein